MPPLMNTGPGMPRLCGQHVLEPTRAARVLDIQWCCPHRKNVSTTSKYNNSSEHNQLHFNINIKSDKTKVKQCRMDFREGNYMEIRKMLAHRMG